MNGQGFELQAVDAVIVVASLARVVYFVHFRAGAASGSAHNQLRIRQGLVVRFSQQRTSHADPVRNPAGKGTEPGYIPWRKKVARVCPLRFSRIWRRGYILRPSSGWLRPIFPLVLVSLEQLRTTLSIRFFRVHIVCLDLPLCRHVELP